MTAALFLCASCQVLEQYVVSTPFPFPPCPSLRLRPDVASSVDALLGAPRGGAGAGAHRQRPGPLLQGVTAQEAAVGPAGGDPATMWEAGGAHPGRLLLAREVLHRLQGVEVAEGPGSQGQRPGGAQGPGQGDMGQGQAGGGVEERCGARPGKAASDGDSAAQYAGGPTSGGWACLPCVEQLRWNGGRAGAQPELRVRLLRPTDVLA